MTDERIIALFWARCQDAIVESCRKYGNYCHCIAHNILTNPQDAEECVNDTWLKAWDTMPPQKPGYLAAYLGRITRNLSIDRFRHLHSQKRSGGQVDLVLSELEECIPAPDSVVQAAEQQLLTETLEAFLDTLPPLRRNLFVRRYWHLESIHQLADFFQMSEGSVTSTLHRTRIQLRSYLEQEGIL